MNTITITAGELLNVNHDLTLICDNFVSSRSAEPNCPKCLNKIREVFLHSLLGWREFWNQGTDSKPIITTQRINNLINEIITSHIQTDVEFIGYVRLLADELKYLSEELKNTPSFTMFRDGFLYGVDDNPQMLVELEIDLSIFEQE